LAEHAAGPSGEQRQAILSSNVADLSLIDTAVLMSSS
jgi:hypothetical protein